MLFSSSASPNRSREMRRAASGAVIALARRHQSAAQAAAASEAATSEAGWLYFSLPLHRSTTHVSSFSGSCCSGRFFGGSTSSSSSGASDSTVSSFTSWLRKALGVGSQEASAGAQSSSTSMSSSPPASRRPTTTSKKKRNPRSSSSSSSPDQISDAQKGSELRKIRKQQQKEEPRATEQPKSRRRRAKEEAAPRANAAPPRQSVAAASASAPKNAAATASAASSSSVPTGPDQPGIIPITYKQIQAAASAAATATEGSAAAKASTKSTKAAGGKRRSNAATAAAAAAVAPPPLPSSSLSTAVRERLSHFEASAAMRDRALALYVNDALFTEAAATFSETFASAAASSSSAANAASSALAALPLGAASDAALFPLFADHVVSRYSRRIAAYRDVVRALDMTSPHLWFPAARALAPRKVTYHAGPTNSGKTHSALEALSRAGSGVYCGPLRLLAMEVADDLNARGVRCDLVTGQEARLVPGSRHVACTVEMAEVRVRSEKVKDGTFPPPSFLSTENEQPLFFDVAVLDEIQLIGDPSRGWAWTRALHGLPAKELHVCGDGSAAALVEALCRRSGDDFELVRHSRFRPLRVEEGPLPRGLADVRPGDCVVAFSRAVRGWGREREREKCGGSISSSFSLLVFSSPPPTSKKKKHRMSTPRGPR